MFKSLITKILRRPTVSPQTAYAEYRDGYEDGYARGWSDAAVSTPSTPSTSDGHTAGMPTDLQPSLFLADRPDEDEPQPLAPLGDSTDAYWYANGVLAYYRNGQMYLHPSPSDHAIVVPCIYMPGVRAAALSMGLSDIDAMLLADAADRYGRRVTLDVVS